MTIIVVHGPPGSGKTRHAEQLRNHFGCAWVFDEWDPRGMTRQRALPQSGDLVLTQCSPDQVRYYLGPGPKIFSIAEALQAIGCGE